MIPSVENFLWDQGFELTDTFGIRLIFVAWFV